eukprot:jgi/Ulvmu1/3974/UM182_0002.1
MADRKLRYIDIGANLLDTMYQGEYHGKQHHEPDLDAVLQRAWDAGVAKIVITAGTLTEARAALHLARTDSRLFCTAGVHPTRCNELDAHEGGGERYMEELREVIREGVAEGKTVAVGECGLDYDRLQFCDAATQRRWFAAQFDLVHEFRLPMFLHMRAARADFVDILSQHLSVFQGGVVHSFTGSVEDAEEVLAVDGRVHVGINGCSMKTEANLDALATVPLDRLMLETDAPWCDCRRTHASAAHITTARDAKDRKKHDRSCLVKGRNEPCNIDQVLQAVAGCRGLQNTFAVAETIYRVTDRLFFPVATERAAEDGAAAEAMGSKAR